MGEVTAYPCSLRSNIKSRGTRVGRTLQIFDILIDPITDSGQPLKPDLDVGRRALLEEVHAIEARSALCLPAVRIRLKRPRCRGDKLAHSLRPRVPGASPVQ